MDLKAKRKSMRRGRVAAFPVLSALGYAMMGGMLAVNPLGNPRIHFDPEAEGGGATPISKIRDALAACAKAMDELEAEMEKDTGDAGAKAKLENDYKAKGAEYIKLKAQLKIAQGKAERVNDLELARALAAVRVPGVIPSGKAALEATDHEKEERAKEELFTNWFGGKSISDSGRDAIAPKSKGWTEGATGVAMPSRFANAIIPERGMFGRALPLTSVQASPGYLFQADFNKQLQMYGGEEPALMDRVFMVPTKSGTVLFPKLKQAAPAAEGAADEFAEWGYVACAWTAEGAEKPGTEPIFEQASLPTYELSASTELSRTLINRSTIDLEALLRSLFRGSIRHKVDNAMINGDGNGKPTGVLQTAGIGSKARDVAAQVSYNDLVDLEHAVAPQLRAGSCYAVADTALAYLKKLKDLNGRPIFEPAMAPAGMTSGAYGTLRGYVCIPNQRQPALGTAGDVIFGNFNQYVAPVEQEVVMLQSEHVKIKSGLIVYVVFVQIGGKVMQLRAFSKLIDH